MKRTTQAIVIGTLAAAVIAAFAEKPATTQVAEKTRTERGRYLVHQAGMCIDCHSPRDEKGQFLESKHLTGAPVGFKPTVEMPWMPVSPPIAGLPAGFSEEAMIHFLMTGERPNGKPTLPPMPPYRLNREDAEAITFYLRDLKR